MKSLHDSHFESIDVVAKRLCVNWLNPEPMSFWGLGDSEMKPYLRYCHIARECSSLRHLERMFDALLRSKRASA
jgi:uncharacterized protein